MDEQSEGFRVQLQPEREHLRAYYERLRGKATDLEAELGRLLNNMEEVAALTYARRALEVIVIDVCEKELKRDRGTEPMDGLLDRFNKEKAIPENIVASMKNLNRLGTFGSHPKPFSTQQVREAFIALATVVDWYVVNYRSILSDSDKVTTGDSTAPVLVANPYMGLDSFEEKDADRFFGREKLVDELWVRFKGLLESGGEVRILPVIGPSGSGKSSLVKAGLVPRLRREMGSVRVEVIKPTERPIENVSNMLAKIATGEQSPVAKSMEFEQLLLTNRDGLRRIVDTLPEIESKPLIVVIDQFEELYTLCKGAEEIASFIENLMEASIASGGRFSAILTLRSDFLGETQRSPAFNQAVTRLGALTPIMSDEELRDAVTKPAEEAGSVIDDATVRLLIDQAREREGALPLLQFALYQIWEGMTRSIPPARTLSDIGGVGGALAKRAEMLFDGLSAEVKPVARRVFLKLVQLGEGAKDTRRRLPVSEMVARGEPAETVRSVLHKFSGHSARLLTLSNEQGIETAEVTHEALLYTWASLREWLDTSREDLRFERSLSEAARNWDNRGRPDGSLWRRPDLDLLKAFHGRNGDDMTELQAAFYAASVRKQTQAMWMRTGVVAALVFLTISSVSGLILSILAGKRVSQERDRARKQKALALAAINQMTYGLVGELRRLPRTYPAVAKILKSDMELLDRLYALDPDPAAMREKGVNLYLLGDNFLALGDTEGALKAYRKDMEITRKLAEKAPGDKGRQRDLAVTLNRLGNIELRVGDTKAAFLDYERSMEIGRKLAGSDPKNIGAQRDLAVAWSKLGDVKLRVGDIKTSIKAYEQCLEIRKKLAAIDPKNREAQRDLAVAWGNLGFVKWRIGDNQAALKAYERCLEISRKLAAEDLENKGAQRDLAVAWENLGNVKFDLGDTQAALKAYGQDMEISRKLAADDPENKESQRDLGVSLEKLGNIKLDTGDIKAALKAYEQCMEISRKLAAGDPENKSAQRDLSVVWDKLGDVKQNMGDSQAALKAYEQSLESRKKLAAGDPENSEAQHDLMVSYYKIGKTQESTGDKAGALQSYDQALTIAQRLALDKSDEQAQEALKFILDAIKPLKH